jgi:hypothetical protein
VPIIFSYGATPGKCELNNQQGGMLIFIFIVSLSKIYKTKLNITKKSFRVNINTFSLGKLCGPNSIGGKGYLNFLYAVKFDILMTSSI